MGGEIATELHWLPAAFAAGGLDFAWIDLEHTLMDLQVVSRHLLGSRIAGITPIVRVPGLDVSLVRRLLDNGAEGVVVPFVESADTAERLVRACRFQPSGLRGAAHPAPAHAYRSVGFDKHVTLDDAGILRCIQIESELGVSRAEEIVSVAGVDVVIVGLADLSLSVGRPGELRNPIVVAAAEEVFSACRSAGVAFGVAGGYAVSELPEIVATWRRSGATFFHLLGDLALLTDAITSRTSAIRAAIETAAG